MSIVASKRLGESTGIGTGNVTLYTCPSNHRTIVKSIIVFNTSGAGTTVQVNIFNGTSQLFGYEFELGARHTATASKEDTPWLVLNAGESLRINCNTAAGAQAAASGAELLL